MFFFYPNMSSLQTIPTDKLTQVLFLAFINGLQHSETTLIQYTSLNLVLSTAVIINRNKLLTHKQKISLIVFLSVLLYLNIFLFTRTTELYDYVTVDRRYGIVMIMISLILSLLLSTEYIPENKLKLFHLGLFVNNIIVSLYSITYRLFLTSIPFLDMQNINHHIIIQMFYFSVMCRDNYLKDLLHRDQTSASLCIAITYVTYISYYLNKKRKIRNSVLTSIDMEGTNNVFIDNYIEKFHLVRSIIHNTFYDKEKNTLRLDEIKAQINNTLPANYIETYLKILDLNNCSKSDFLKFLQYSKDNIKIFQFISKILLINLPYEFMKPLDNVVLKLLRSQQPLKSVFVNWTHILYVSLVTFNSYFNNMLFNIAKPHIRNLL